MKVTDDYGYVKSDSRNAKHLAEKATINFKWQTISTIWLCIVGLCNSKFQSRVYLYDFITNGMYNCTNFVGFYLPLVH